MEKPRAFLRGVRPHHSPHPRRLRRASEGAEAGGGTIPVALDEALYLSDERPEQWIALDEALSRMAQVNQRQARVVECRFYGFLAPSTDAARGPDTGQTFDITLVGRRVTGALDGT